VPYGNRCGHDPNAPRLHPAREGVERLPPLLQEAARHLREFYDAPEFLPTLSHRKARRAVRSIAKQFRCMRSERREACIALLSTLLYRTELASGLIGFPTKKGFYCLTLQQLADEAGLSLSRAKEAQHDLVHAGLLTCHARYRRVDGEFRGAASVRKLSKVLWNALGLGLKLKQEAKKASKRLRKLAEKEACRVGELVRTKLEQMTGGPKAGASPAAPPKDLVTTWLGYQPLDMRKWLQRRAAEISRDGPGRFESYRQAAVELGIRGPASSAP
jgi:hypothetical protein